MQEVKSGQRFLLQENQQLKIEITELRNAFNINKEILNILSVNKDVSKRHFYVMLRKLNEYVYDLSEQQMVNRNDRVNADKKISALEQALSIIQQKAQLDNVQLGCDRKVVIHQRKIIEPRQSCLIMLDEIKTVANQAATLKQELKKLKIQNLDLKRRTNKEKCRHCQVGIPALDYGTAPQAQVQSKKLRRSASTCYDVQYATVQTGDDYLQVISRLTRTNEHLNGVVSLLSKGMKAMDKVSKFRKVQNFRSENILIDLIQGRIQIECLDYPNAKLTKKLNRGKSL